MTHTHLPPQLAQDMSDLINYWHGYFRCRGWDSEAPTVTSRDRLYGQPELSIQLKALAERIKDKGTLYAVEEVEIGAPHGSPIRECQTCGERYSEDQVKFYDGICEDCYEADQIEESQRLEEQWQNEVRRGIG